MGAKRAMKRGVSLKDHIERCPPPLDEVRSAPVSSLSWQEYIEADKKPVLGRQMKKKSWSKQVQARMWVSDEFPITTQDLVDILSVFEAAHPHIKSLKHFIAHKMPHGFPVKLSVPLVPTVSAHITFNSYTKVTSKLAPALFQVPKHYQEQTDTVCKQLLEQEHSSSTMC
eukprot:m.287397 g.287397  ORF g.287397 m.287397 type:complete len:170 (+) comp15790_c2_seq5:1305-1814(+)